MHRNGGTDAGSSCVAWVARYPRRQRHRSQNVPVQEYVEYMLSVRFCQRSREISANISRLSLLERFFCRKIVLTITFPASIET